MKRTISLLTLISCSMLVAQEKKLNKLSINSPFIGGLDAVKKAIQVPTLSSERNIGEITINIDLENNDPLVLTRMYKELLSYLSILNHTVNEQEQIIEKQNAEINLLKGTVRELSNKEKLALNRIVSLQECVASYEKFVKEAIANIEKTKESFGK